jgi:hypothetical protein
VTADGGVLSDGDVCVRVGEGVAKVINGVGEDIAGVGVGVSVRVGVVFVGSVGDSTGITAGVTGIEVVNAGDGGVEGVGAQPNSTSGISTNATK